MTRGVGDSSYKDNVISAISDSGVCITGLVNHSLTCVLLDTAGSNCKFGERENVEEEGFHFEP